MIRFLFIWLLLLPYLSFSQNLLVNGGFEEENICAEYKVNCAPEGWIYTIPSFDYYFKDAATARSGSKYVAVVAGHALRSYFRSFIRSRLMCRLQEGKQYQIQFYVKSQHPILDSVGIYFSKDDILLTKTPYQKIQPSLYLTNAVQKPVNGNLNWQKVVLNYTATGNEYFIAIGNFKKEDIIGRTGIEEENHFYVWIDDISLTASDPNERLCKDWQTTRKQIYAQDERHAHLAKYISQNRNKPPAVKPLTSTLTLVIDTLTVPDVFFATNSFVLNQRSTALLDSFAAQINTIKIDSIVIHGHTDAMGSYQHNKELSSRRAMSVAAFLNTFVKANYVTRGLASDHPIAENFTERGRQKNRRVEIFIYRKVD